MMEYGDAISIISIKASVMFKPILWIFLFLVASNSVFAYSTARFVGGDVGTLWEYKFRCCVNLSREIRWIHSDGSAATGTTCPDYKMTIDSNCQMNTVVASDVPSYTTLQMEYKDAHGSYLVLK